MSTGNEELREGFETQPPPSEWDTRDGMMSKEEIQQLGEGRGCDPGYVAERAEQEGQEGYQEGGDPVQRADMEGGVAGQLKAKKARIKEVADEEKANRGETEEVDAKDWTKYDWA
jgi:hypothetical protein